MQEYSIHARRWLWPMLIVLALALLLILRAARSESQTTKGGEPGVWVCAGGNA